jgi:hypothetical protein
MYPYYIDMRRSHENVFVFRSCQNKLSQLINLFISVFSIDVDQIDLAGRRQQGLKRVCEKLNFHRHIVIETKLCRG